MRHRFLNVLSIGVAALLFPVIAAADSSALIIAGIGGSPEHEAKFTKWSVGTRDVLVNEMGFAADHVMLLTAQQTAKPSIESTFAELKKQLKPQDTFLLFLIGHGSFDLDYKLNISGADMTGAEYSKLLGTLDVGRVGIVISTPSSGGAFETMGGKNRVVVAAARSGEKEDTVFYEHFLAGLQKSAADEDKDKKVSLWEAFKYATSNVERFYKEQGRILTEHAAISASGAPAAAAVTAATNVQEVPAMARLTSMNADRPVVVADPRLQALLDEKKELEKKVEALQLNKSLMPPAEYENQLEDLVLQLSRKNQQIREQEKK